MSWRVVCHACGHKFPVIEGEPYRGGASALSCCDAPARHVHDLSEPCGFCVLESVSTDADARRREYRAKAPPCVHCGKVQPLDPNLFHVCAGMAAQFQRDMRALSEALEGLDLYRCVDDADDT